MWVVAHESLLVHPTQLLLLQVASLPEPLDGVEGSVIKHEPTQWLFLSNPNEDSWIGLRYNMTLKVSRDYGTIHNPSPAVRK